MRKIIPLFVCLLLLAACGSKGQKPAAPDDPGAPQIATTIDDAGLPVDKSDQITSIDAATGDASGMPADGGAVIAKAKPAAQAAVAPEDANVTQSKATVVPPTADTAIPAEQ